MKSIQSKFLTITISGLLITIFAIGSVCLYSMNNILHHDADMILESVCQKDAAEINSTLGKIESAVLIMEQYAQSELESIASLSDAAYRDTYTMQMEDMFFSIAENTNKAVSFYIRYNPEFTTATSGFRYDVDVESGKFVKTEPADLSVYGKDENSRVGRYYIPAEGGMATWLPPYQSKVNGMHMVSYVVPMYKDDTLAGIVGMDVDYPALTKKIDQITAYENSYAYLLDANGSVLHRPEDNHHTVNTNAAKRFSESSATLHNGMTLVLHAHYDDIQHSRYVTMNYLILLSAVILVLFVFFTVLMTRKIVQPLRKLASAAESVSEGKVNVDLECDSNDEVGTLSLVFKQTLERMQEYVGYINALAYRDSLTGLKNRTAYTEAINELEKRMNCSSPEYAVLVADINGLKEVNDTYGHDIGNQLIIRVSKIISGVFLRSSVYRIGGDEFVIILENRDFEEYRTLLEKLDAECAKESITIEQGSLPISIARGVAIYNREVDHVFQDVFRHADDLMYMHKRSSKAEQ